MKQTSPTLQAPSPQPQPQLSSEEIVVPSAQQRGWKRAWRELQNFFLMVIGVILAALGYALFQIPFNIAAGGISGVSIIINH